MTKSVFLFFISLIMSGSAFAQNAYQSIGISGGLSVFNTKSVTLQFETSRSGNFGWGLFGEAVYYDYQTKPFKFSRSSKNRIGLGGLYLKWKLYATRNLSSEILLGCGMGSDNTDFIIEPFSAIDQNFYLSGGVIFFLREKVGYLYNVPHGINWQPSINVGLKFKL